MNDYVLRTVPAAEAVLAELFTECLASGGEHLRLEVHEDTCFHPDTWVSVGTISLHPEVPGASLPEDRKSLLDRAFGFGFFDWTIPGREYLAGELTRALAIEVTDRNRERISKDISEAAKGVACSAIRCGLAHPAFDAIALSTMPFRSTVGVVMDTTAVLQGGLDFAARHLTPAAQLRVPAIVQMEILNFVDNYFKGRRKGNPSSRVLLDHVLSQTGQRALVRLGLAHQVERPRLGAEPLRGIVQPDSDAEDKSLGLQRVQRSFADRLILETAVQRQKDVPSHPVLLMTADQGLARMALGEGIEPIFFDADAAYDLLGCTLSGVTFKPFPTIGNTVYTVSLGSVLWELAVAFGSARLISIASGDSFEAAAIGRKLSWQPYHARDDLLWTKTRRSNSGATAATVDRTKTSATDQAALPSRTLSGAQVFSPRSMINLMVALDRGPLSDDEGVAAARVKKVSTYRSYWRFLHAGGFAVKSESRLEKTKRLGSFVRSMASREFDEMRILLVEVPAFGRFLGSISVGTPLTQADSEIHEDVFSPFCALAELCCAGVRFADTGVYATPKDPTPEAFSRFALDAYDSIRQGGDYVLTGSWLDELARRFGIHPARARQRLAEAHQGGYIRRYVEGSTPETRYRKRNIHVLGFDSGTPVVQRVNLYYGDFLMPGRAAVSIRLSGGER